MFNVLDVVGILLMIVAGIGLGFYPNAVRNWSLKQRVPDWHRKRYARLLSDPNYVAVARICGIACVVGAGLALFAQAV